MDPWSAPYQKSDDYWCFADDQKTSGSNFLQTAVVLVFEHSATPKDLTRKMNYKQIQGAASTVQQRFILR